MSLFTAVIFDSILLCSQPLFYSFDKYSYIVSVWTIRKLDQLNKHSCLFLGPLGIVWIGNMWRSILLYIFWPTGSLMSNVNFTVEDSWKNCYSEPKAWPILNVSRPISPCIHPPSAINRGSTAHINFLALLMLIFLHVFPDISFNVVYFLWLCHLS